MAKRIYIQTVAAMPAHAGGQGRELSPESIRIMNAIKDGKAHKVIVDTPREMIALVSRIYACGRRIGIKPAVKQRLDQGAVYFQKASKVKV